MVIGPSAQVGERPEYLGLGGGGFQFHFIRPKHLTLTSVPASVSSFRLIRSLESVLLVIVCLSLYNPCPGSAPNITARSLLELSFSPVWLPFFPLLPYEHSFRS